MSSRWHSRKRDVRVESTRVVERAWRRGRYATRHELRAELMNRVREIARRMEFQAAGEDTEQNDAGLRAEIDRLYGAGAGGGRGTGGGRSRG